MRGRKPKPTILKLIAGKPGHSPLPKGEVFPAGELCGSPAFLTDSQAVIWRYAIENCPGGLLRLLDRDLFLNWVRAVADLNEAAEHLQAEGQVVERGGLHRVTEKADGTKTETTVSPTFVPSPWRKVYREAFDQMIRSACELGFSPTSRSRIGSLAGSGEKDANRFSKHAANRS